MTSDAKHSRRVATAVFATVEILVAAGIFISCKALVPTPRQGWNRSMGPVVPHDKFPADCSLCHTGNNWSTIRKDFSFDHEKQTGLALVGAHANVQCLMCHNDRGSAAKFASRGCAGCHVDVHRGQLGHTCADCHNERSWEPIAAIARHNRTRFPLVGAHAATACFACHPGAQVGNFKGADTRCLTCHRADLARATSPPHTTAQFTQDCQKCHSPTGWKPAAFNHPARFPLVGGHAGVACNVCHKGGVFTGLSTDCASCHLTDYQRTTDPNHAASGFGTDCRSCHNTTTWLNAKFAHPAAFPLTGGHGGIACSACHKNGTYTALPTDCASCHLADFQKTTNPNHTAAGFGTQCATCHTTQTWAGATFNHTAFPLTGPHNLACNQCHTDPNNTAVFSCTTCHAHNQADMTSLHADVGGFVWQSQACYNCHSRGNVGDLLRKHGHPKVKR